MRARFKDHPEHLKFDLSTSQPDTKDGKIYNYFKFCKLVAHSYVDNLDVGHEKDF